MWYRKANSWWEDVEKEAVKTLEQEQNLEKPLLTDIDDPNEIAQYVAMDISDYCENEAKKKEPPRNIKDKPYFDNVRENIKNIARKSLEEVGIFQEEYLPRYKEILEEALDKTLKFKGLKFGYEAKEGGVYNWTHYKWFLLDVWKVFRYIFARMLVESGMFPGAKLKFYKFRTRIMNDLYYGDEDYFFDDLFPL